MVRLAAKPANSALSCFREMIDHYSYLSQGEIFFLLFCYEQRANILPNMVMIFSSMRTTGQLKSIIILK